jgi:hypothetical protein
MVSSYFVHISDFKEVVIPAFLIGFHGENRQIPNSSLAF